MDVAGTTLLSDGDEFTEQRSFGFVHACRNPYAQGGESGRISLTWAFSLPATTCPVLRIEREDHVEERVLQADGQWVNTFRRRPSLWAGRVAGVCEPSG
ncbi:hypothetical protein [Streptomyces cinnamoneus]|uniref:Uncharacterized protein n=1 Tax=Streptomyces cinnamoneus TaxID=53446 RepID=A0A918WEG3_STRCJ|nr:hypothetical protein [Streptomyces cinnamoneus]GHC38472.1 hypothetical protein GCM10010507_10010 [Streptomyces cinnamoneus]